MTQWHYNGLDGHLKRVTSKNQRMVAKIKEIFGFRSEQISFLKSKLKYNGVSPKWAELSVNLGNVINH